MQAAFILFTKLYTLRAKQTPRNTKLLISGKIIYHQAGVRSITKIQVYKLNVQDAHCELH